MINPPLKYTGQTFTNRWESCKLEAYWDDLGKVWTIGWGETEGVKKGDVWTQAYADSRRDLRFAVIAEKICRDWTSPIRPNQDEFNPLCDMAYNIGIGALEHSTLWKMIMAGDWDGALAQFTLWDHANGKEVYGLLLRCRGRAAEFSLGIHEEDENGPESKQRLPQQATQPSRVGGGGDDAPAGQRITQDDIDAGLREVGDPGHG